MKKKTPNLHYLSKEATKWYHYIGDRLLVEGYWKMEIINNNQKDKIIEWLENTRDIQLLKKTKEYVDLKKVIENS